MNTTRVAGSWLVRIEVQRIQTFLFAISRLRAMLGANALLGHELRHVLPSKANGTRSRQFSAEGSPSVLDPLTESRVAQALPPSAKITDLDKPEECYGRGVLTRDAGHLRVLFREEEDAKLYRDLVRRRLAKHLPGLRCSIRIDPVKDDTRGPLEGTDSAPEAVELDDLPQFQVCEASGSGPAEAVSKDTSEPRARDATLKLDAGKAFQEGKGGFRDLISLLRPLLPGYSNPKYQPEDLEDLADEGRYIALIHADGNGVGSRLTAYRDKLKGLPWIERESRIERFFHTMRVAVRRSLVDAIRETFPVSELEEDEKRGEKPKLRYQLLMLGGDDILLVCRPRYALPLLVELARRLEEHELPDGEPLSIGAGIVISKHSLPFHRLHAVAEDLAASAKRRFLQNHGTDEQEPVRRSVVDWTVATTSWIDDPTDQRRRYELVSYKTDNDEETLALTARPYFLLDPPQGVPSTQDDVSLERLIEDVEELAKSKPPRSRLKTLAQDLAGGRRWGRLRYREVRERLPDGAKKVLQRIASADSPWIDLNESRYLTRVRDLIELYELRYLGRRKQEKEAEANE